MAGIWPSQLQRSFKMYVPRPFSAPENEDTASLVNELGFGVLFSSHEMESHATSIPANMLSLDGRLVLEGHMARANPQTAHIRAGASAIFVVTGPHAQISPTWYDHVNVPTWNYVSVQVAGTLSPVEDPALVKESLRRLVSKYEDAGKYSVDSLPEDFFRHEVMGLMAFRLQVQKATPCFKLSQNRNARDYKEIASRLEQRKMPGDCEIAAFMRRVRPEIQ
jgi:transcriptional regulator